MGSKIIPLRDALDVNFAKTDMIIHRDSVSQPGNEEEEDFDKLA